jgi:hypothetical protein
MNIRILERVFALFASIRLQSTYPDQALILHVNGRCRKLMHPLPELSSEIPFWYMFPYTEVSLHCWHFYELVRRSR